MFKSRGGGEGVVTLSLWNSFWNKDKNISLSGIRKESPISLSNLIVCQKKRVYSHNNFKNIQNYNKLIVKNVSKVSKHHGQNKASLLMWGSFI